MPISIAGSGTITGILAGGLPDDCITTAEIAANAVTTAKLGTNEASGLCKAWVNWNGTGTVAIRASYNVSSITDDGTGEYTVSFTTAMPDANYAVVFGGQRSVSYQAANIMQINSQSTVGVAVKTADSGTGFDDYTIVNVAIFR